MSIGLQNIDCNCNNCAFMQRDFKTYSKYESWNKQIQIDDFNKKKQNAFDIAEKETNPKSKQTLLHYANKMKFKFDKSKCLQYGICIKLKKSVSFIPNTCQIETQHCFI